MKLTDRKIFDGQTEKITMTNLRSAPGDIITQVQMGKTFEIYKQGKIVAVLSAPIMNAAELAKAIREHKK
jgi:hypothetical protein